jgi:thiol:disulfide interchange protein DsbG
MNPIIVPARTLVVALAIFLNTAAIANAASPSSRVDAVLTGAPKAIWIAEGQGRRIVYLFFDPNCPSCALLYRNLRPFISSHDLQLRWIPVAVVNASSLGKAAAILEAPDPQAALRRNEENYDTQGYAGGIAEEIPSTAAEEKLRANERLLKRLDIPVVPTMLFAGKEGRPVLIQGALSPLALRKVFAHLP